MIWQCEKNNSETATTIPGKYKSNKVFFSLFTDQNIKKKKISLMWGVKNKARKDQRVKYTSVKLHSREGNATELIPYNILIIMWKHCLFITRQNALSSWNEWHSSLNSLPCHFRFCTHHGSSKCHLFRETWSLWRRATTCPDLLFVF